MTEETVRADPDRNVGPNEGVRPREKWANKWEFILSLTGMLFNLENIARFPFLAYINGGGAFFFAYCVCLFFIGMPMLFLETALGQYTSEGAVTAWRKICPMFQGVGIASQVIVTYGNIYFIVILSWVILYFVNSFRSPLPWSTCENVWNTESCHSHVSVFANPHLFRPDANWSFLNNITFSEDFAVTDYMSEMDTHNVTTTPEHEFWIARVLRMSEDMSLGKVHWDVALCLLLAWVICYFCTWKGIRILGKVVYITVALPYVLLVILFFRGVTLPGVAAGLRYYFSTNSYRWISISLWVSALYEVLYTHAVSLGVLTTLGSYNKYNKDCYRDCWAVSCLMAVTNIIVSLVVLSVLGFLAHELNVDIADIAPAGLNLLFSSLPSALSMLPAPSFWAVLFFFMIFLLALDNQCLYMESLATAITDLFPRYLRRPWGREILVLVIAVVSFLLGLPLITNGGIYHFTLIDYYSNSHFSLLIIVGLEAVIISWVYGADRFYDNIEDMIGYKPFPVLKYCWMFIIPLVCWLTLMYEVERTGYMFTINEYVPSVWYRALGGVIIASVLICIPVFILVALCRDAKNMTRSSRDLRQAQPYRPVLSLCKRVIFEGQQRPIKSVEEGNEKLMMEENYKLWVSALYEVLYTQAVSLGVLTTLGSYNKYNNDCYRDCWAVSCLIAVTSFVAGVAVFSMIGFMAHERSVEMNEVIDGGGIHLFSLFDQCTIIDFVIIGLEAVIISWGYGADRFYDNIEDTIGYKPFPVLKYCWMFIIPLVCWFVLNGHGSMIPNEAFRTGSNLMLALMLVSVLICIPAFMLVSLCKDAKNMTRSSKDLRQARPYRPQLSLCKRVISMGQQRLIRSTEEGNEKLMMEENYSV